MSTADPQTLSPAVSPKRPSGVRAWAGRIAAVVAVVLFGWGSLLLADWLHDRGEVGQGFAAASARGGKYGFPAAPRDPRMDVWLDPGVAWGTPRRTSFGKDTAFVATGTSHEGPGDVFQRRLLAVAGAMNRKGLDAFREGPSAALALRLNATVSNGPICASLVRLPPDVASHGSLRTEAGVVMLAFRAPGRWDYLTFWFPKGLDLTALVREAAPSPKVLALLGPEAERSLVPTLALGGEGATQGSRTVLCRANGPAGAAIDRVATSLLVRGGWRDAEANAASKTPGARVLTGPSGTVWMASADPDQQDGLVTVLVEAP